MSLPARIEQRAEWKTVRRMGRERLDETDDEAWDLEYAQAVQDAMSEAAEIEMEKRAETARIRRGDSRA